MPFQKSTHIKSFHEIRYGRKTLFVPNDNVIKINNINLIGYKKTNTGILWDVTSLENERNLMILNKINNLKSPNINLKDYNIFTESEIIDYIDDFINNIPEHLKPINKDKKILDSAKKVKCDLMRKIFRGSGSIINITEKIYENKN